MKKTKVSYKAKRVPLVPLGSLNASPVVYIPIAKKPNAEGWCLVKVDGVAMLTRSVGTASVTKKVTQRSEEILSPFASTD